MPFSLFQNLALGKASTDDECHFTRVSLFFSEFESRQKLNQSQMSFDNLMGVHLVNINVYAKFHHNILLSSRDSVIITFSEFGARQSLDQ